MKHAVLAELAARFAAVIVLVVFPAGILAHRYAYPPQGSPTTRVFELVGRAPEAGGWSLEVIKVNRGDTVRLHLTSHDVVHGFAIGKLGIDTGPILPGEVRTVEFVADRPGRFTFYCNVWCSPHHPRMRGTLEVSAPPGGAPEADEEPAPDFSRLDLDGPHEGEHYPVSRPSVSRGRATLSQAGAEEVRFDLWRQSPSDVFAALRAADYAASLSDDEIWDLVAYLHLGRSGRERLAVGEALYAKNCLACHGESGRGDGPGSRYVAAEMPDFSDRQAMAGASSELLYAKVRRGGMGTGMPYWGAVFTEDETRSVVDYLWTFMYEYEDMW